MAILQKTVRTPFKSCWKQFCTLTFRHVSDDDSDEKDDSIEPVVAEDECDDEEAHAEKDGHCGDLKHRNPNWCPELRLN